MSLLKQKSNFLILLLLVLFAVPAILSLLHKGFFLTDDGEWMVIRFSAFYQALGDGQFPVRFLSRLNHEYGYPVANFLYPGFMYLGIPIHLLGFGFVDTIKIIFGLSMVLSGVFSYFWLSTRFDRWASIVGAMFYLYVPYHLYDLYKRGSIGEVLALAILPFILWMIERRGFLFTTLGIAFLILSHNTLAVLFLPLIFGYMLLRKVSSIRNQICSIILGVGIATFFWLPALIDLQYTTFFQTKVSNFEDHFVSFSAIGLGTWAVLLLSFFLLRKKTSVPSALLLSFFSIGVVATTLSLPVSELIWRFLPVSFVQFPFRFLSITILAVAFLSAYVVSQFVKTKKTIVICLLIALLAVSAIPLLQPSTFFDKGDSYYATNEDTTTVKNEYMPKWVKTTPAARAEKLVEVNGKIENMQISSNRISFNATVANQTDLIINKVYFPGWKLYVDGVLSPIFYNNDKGVITFPAYPGTHTYEAKFSDFATSQIADILSVVSIGYLVFLVVKKKKEYAIF